MRRFLDVEIDDESDDEQLPTFPDEFEGMD